MTGNKKERPSKIFALPEHIVRKINSIIDSGGTCGTIIDIIKNEYKGNMKGVYSRSSVIKYIKQYKAKGAEYNLIATGANAVDGELSKMQSLALQSSAIDPLTGKVIWTQNNVTEMLIDALNQYEERLAWISRKPAYEMTPSLLAVYEKYLSGKVKLGEIIKKLKGELQQDDSDITELLNDKIYVAHKIYLDSIKEIYGEEKHDLFMAKLEMNCRLSQSKLRIPPVIPEVNKGENNGKTAQ